MLIYMYMAFLEGCKIRIVVKLANSASAVQLCKLSGMQHLLLLVLSPLFKLGLSHAALWFPCMSGE